METEFYASIKLISGEEIFAMVSPTEEEDRTLLILENPVIIEPMVSRNQGTVGYKIKPWMMIPDDDIYIIDMNKVITMTEVNNEQIIRIYHKFIKNSSQVTLEKHMGFISKVDDARRVLEKLYNSN
jgi:hypothetical protein